MAEKEHIRNLLKRIANRDDKTAFSVFFQRYHSKLVRFALMFLSSYQDAEDVVSEVMIKLLRQRKKLCQINNFEGYLYLAVKNQALNQLSKNNKASQKMILAMQEDRLTSLYVQPFEHILEKELRTLITRTVESLPPQRKAIYKMIKDDGLKCKEVAVLLEISDKTVKKHLELAIRDLKQALEEYYSDQKSSAPVIRMAKNLVVGLISSSVVWL